MVYMWGSSSPIQGEPVTTTKTSVAQHWIDGEWTDSEEHRDSVNPATGEIIGS